MKKLLTLALLVSTSLAAAQAQPLIKVLTCKRMISPMFGDFQQGDFIYADIYVGAGKKPVLEVVSETNEVLAQGTAAALQRANFDIDQSMISASWAGSVPLQLVLAYFGGTTWSGLITFPSGIESSKLNFAPGGELEMTCREVNFDVLL